MEEQKEWEEELWTLSHFLGDDEDQEKEEDDQDSVETIDCIYKGGNAVSAVWRKTTLLITSWIKNTSEKLLNVSIPRVRLLQGIQLKTCLQNWSNTLEVSQKRKRTRGGKKCYWPLVKCVTVRVPKKGLLRHVTLVDLPGNRDRNKSRDPMWKKVVGSCSTVWIVAETNRAASEKESWAVLEESCSLMGNGGECQQIHLICTKSDSLGGSDDQSAADVRALILKQNEQAKIDVKAEFSKLKDVKF
ncbi:nuclear GTPase SLIP-GC-like [Pseudochaenichthys georgianus]|uniref:nuclear GTPase SLIP-GC-like n=2 Tax=Pseudochaenichthys georgianus TaxID=52239 RepID=UPI00146BBB7F|nr:nuclear GTPase SLIP-GC-like [Pseudochaenichthys georgianus]